MGQLRSTTWETCHGSWPRELNPPYLPSPFGCLQTILIISPNSFSQSSRTALVFIMIPGLGFFYAGLLRRKSALAQLWLSMAVMSVVMFEFFFWGFSLAFSETANAFIGDLRHFGLMGVDINPSVGVSTLPSLLYCIYQMMFGEFLLLISRYWDPLIKRRGRKKCAADLVFSCSIFLQLPSLPLSPVVLSLIELDSVRFWSLSSAGLPSSTIVSQTLSRMKETRVGERVANKVSSHTSPFSFFLPLHFLSTCVPSQPLLTGLGMSVSVGQTSWEVSISLVDRPFTSPPVPLL